MRVRKPALALAAGVALLATACGGDSGTAASPTPSPSEAASSAAPSPTQSGPPARGDADLVIWSDDKRAAALKPFADKFGTDNGIKVAVQPVSKDLQTNYVTATTSGNGPDIVVGAHDWIGNLVQNGTIAPMTLTDAQKGAYDPIAIKGVTFDGKVYGLPYAVESIALFRNTELAPTAPKTFEDMIAAGTKLKTEGKVTEPFIVQQGQPGDPYHLMPLFTSGGGGLFGTTPAGDPDPKQVLVGSPGSVAAMTEIAKYGEKGKNIIKRSVTGDNALSFFTDKKTPFILTGAWNVANMKTAGIKYAIDPFPGFAGKKPAQPFVGVQAFFVSSKAKNAAFAQEFVLNAINTPEAQKALYEAEPRVPAMTSVVAEVKASNPDIEALQAAAKDGLILPAIPAMAAVWDPLGKSQAAIIGGADPASTMASAQAAIVKAIG